MIRAISHIVSYVFHPLFMMVYMLLLLIQINPFLFPVQDPKSQGLIIIQVIFTTILLPIIAIAMMKLLGLIESVNMRTRMERVGPMITVGIMYIWLFLNIRNNDYIPDAYSYFVLGATIALFIAFFLNNFTKISLHAIGMGGLLGAFVITYNAFSYDTFNIGPLVLNRSMLVIIGVLVTGIVSSARMVLGEHKPDEIYGGLLIGVASQIFAFGIIF